MNEKLKVLKSEFGFTSFREPQEQIIDAVSAGNDLFAVLPTGGGKSLCFQIPALMDKKGFTVVVSPLIALMKDQVSTLIDKGIMAAAINGSSSFSAIDNIFSMIEQNKLKLLYVTPERLASAPFLLKLFNLYNARPLTRVVFDEAHCVSMWGKDFRPSFLRAVDAVYTLERFISNKLAIDCRIPISAFTASASEEVKDDLKKLIFGDREIKTFFNSPARPNIEYSTVSMDNETQKLSATINFLNEHNGPAIIYCATTKQVETLTQALQLRDLPAVAYHGQLDKRSRNVNQDDWLGDKKRIMVATNAFGMGIDKFNVRAVIHYQLPASIDDFYQESGRAGRDGNPSHSLLIYSHDDYMLRENMVLGSFPSQKTTEAVKTYIHHLCQANQNEPIELSAESIKIAIGGQQKDPLLLRQVQSAIKELLEVDWLASSGEFTNPLFSISKPDAQIDYATLEKRKEHNLRMLDLTRQYATTSQCKRNFILAFYNQHQHEDCGSCSSCRKFGANQTLLNDGIPLAKPIERSKEDLVDALTKLRTSLSKKHGAPEISILTESQIQTIAEVRPNSIDSLRLIKGMSDRKIEILGQDVIRCMQPSDPLDVMVQNDFKKLVKQEMRELMNCLPPEAIMWR